MKPFHAYMLRCADGSYYVGHTDDLDHRIAQHQTGSLGGYTRTRRPVELVWAGEAGTRAEVLAFELQLKGWSRAKKEALIRGDWDAIKRFARGVRNQYCSLSKGSVRAELVEAPPGTSTSSVRTVQSEQYWVRNPLPLHTDGLVASPPINPSIPQAPRHLGTIGRPSIPQDEWMGVVDRPLPVRLEVSKGSDLLVDITGAPGPAQRRAIAKAITLLESTRTDHRALADQLLTSLLPDTGKAIRLGISGVPGVGKSTFIEVLGLFLINLGHRVAVLAVDPSSSLSGGSILGDKTRMERLSMDERAFIRPSPASGTLGGVAEKTREAMLVCEAAGYSVVMVETVGVGQSETAVANMTDMFVLLQLPNAGDDLQAIKKGVMEIADLVVINKADLDEAAATRARAQITSAMRWLGPHTHAVTRVIQLSALKGSGVEEFWQMVLRFCDERTASGESSQRRQLQDQAWMWERIEAGLHQRFKGHSAVREALPSLSAQVREGRLAASVAARQLLDLWATPEASAQ